MKVNLKMLNSLVADLNKQNDMADGYADNEDSSLYVSELCKALGLASGIVQEATALVGDYAQLIKRNSMPNANKDGKDIAELFSGLLGPSSVKTSKN